MQVHLDKPLCFTKAEKLDTFWNSGIFLVEITIVVIIMEFVDIVIVSVECKLHNIQNCTKLS